MQLNNAMNKENLSKLEGIINKLSILKLKLESNTVNQEDLDVLDAMIIREKKLLSDIADSIEDVTYMKPYLKKCGSTYNISICPSMSRRMGFSEDSRDIIYVLDKESEILIIKKANEYEDFIGYKKYKAHKSKSTAKGITFNLGIPRKILDSIIEDSEAQMRVAVRKGVIEIRKK